ESRTGEAVEAAGISGVAGADQVRGGNELQEVEHHRRADRSDLVSTRHGGRDRQLLMLSQALVRQEEEEFVADDGTAEVGAKLIGLERRLSQRLARSALGGVKEVTRVQSIVAQKLESLAVIAVRARASGHVGHGARIPAVLSGERRVVDLHFRERVDGRLE